MKYSVKTLTGMLGLIFVGILLNIVIDYKFGTSKELLNLPYKSYVSVDSVDKTLDCLAMNIYQEAGYESFEGKVAVAQVTLNRVDNPKFPKDVCKVVTQKTFFDEKVVCQFSWYCMGRVIKKPNNNAYEESYRVAKKVLLEGFRLDSLNDALYYHASYVHPNWPHQKLTQIGNHIFYKPRG